MPRRIVNSVLSGYCSAVFSQDLVKEYESVLLGRAARYHGMSRDSVRDAIADLWSYGEMLAPPRPGLAAPDLDDQHVWDLLHAVPDAVLVTGDEASS
jgi:hypothetical protein